MKQTEIDMLWKEVKQSFLKIHLTAGGLSQHKRSGGTIYDSINDPGGPFMSSYLVQPDHLCIDMNGLGKT